MAKTRRLVVIPPCAEYLVSHSWIKAAKEEGAVVIRHISDRDAILAEAFDQLGIDPRPNSANLPPLPEIPSAHQEKEQEKPRKEYPYDDVAETFLAAGLCCLMEELLTRKLRYMSNLDQISFNTRIVDASKAYMSGDAEESEKNLQKAFDLLAQAKEYFFPTATKFIDLTWVLREDLKSDLLSMLKNRRLRKEQSNLVLPVPVLKDCAARYPETLQFIKEEVEAERVKIIGSDEWEAPLYLMSPMEIARELKRGRDEYLRLLGTAPIVFGRQEAGYAQIMPQLLKMSGYRGALARTGDGWTLLEKKTDRSQIRWQGRDGSMIAAICKIPLDASNAEDILQMPDKIGNSYYSEDASAIVFSHRPNKESRWLRDILRMDRYSPVLGKFYDINEYLRITDGTGDKEKFVKDRFKTNFLTRSAKRDRADLVSLWPQRRRLGLAHSALSQLETTLRCLVFKVRNDANKKLEPLFEKYIQDSNALKEEIDATLCELDERLLPVEAPEVEPVDFTARFKNLEEKKAALEETASQFLSLALDSSEQKRDPEFPEELENDRGFLIVNASSTPQDFVWETRDRSEDEDQTEQDKAKRLLMTSLREKLVNRQDGALRAFSKDDSSRWRYCATIPANASLWIPAFDEVDCHFLTRPLFETTEGPTPLMRDDAKSNGSAPSEKSAETASKRGSFQEVRVEVARRRCQHCSVRRVIRSGKEDDPAEYVEYRYSAAESDRFYALRNDYFEPESIRDGRDSSSSSFSIRTQPSPSGRFATAVLGKPLCVGRRVQDY